MSTALELVYQYRQLAGKCDTCGLDMEEIDLMTTIEALFKDRGRGDMPRRFARESVDLAASLRGRGHVDEVRIDNLAPGGLVCQHAPYYEEDDTVEIVIEDQECSLSYRFKAKVTWVREEPASDDYTLGVRFIGQPVLLRYAPGPDTDEEVANAA